MADEPLSFKVNGHEYPMPTDLTLGEMCDAERFFGVAFGSDEQAGMRMAAALLWIAIRRVDATVTVDDVRGLPADVFAEFAKDEAATVPPENAADANGRSERSGGNSSTDSDSPDAVLVPTGPPG